MTNPTQVPNLLNSLQLGELTLKNRVAMAPLTRARAGVERIPNALMAEYYSQRANAGLIVTEATSISPQGNGWKDSPGIYTPEQVEGWKAIVSAVHQQDSKIFPGLYTPEQVEGWKAIVSAVHQQDSKIFLQLWHTGRASHPSFQIDSQLPVAPSAIKIEGSEAHTPNGKQPFVTPRALETAEISQVVEQYRQAAANAKAAGFDGVEIHGANGYLIDEFLQAKTNQRTDQYGGNIANRYRFLQEVVEAVLTVWDASRVGVRLSPNGVFNDMGSPDYRESFSYIIQQLDSYNLGYLHVMDGLGFGFHELGEPMTLAEIRKIYRGILMGNCGYDRHSAEEAIAEGHADLITFGRPYISNPDLAVRFANNWELNPESDPATWYSFEAEGYTDYPTYEESSVKA